MLSNTFRFGTSDDYGQDHLFTFTPNNIPTMKRITYFAVTAAFLLSGFSSVAQEKKNPPKKAMRESPAAKPVQTPTAASERKFDMMGMDKLMETYKVVSPMHELIAKFDGSWKEEMTMWLGGGAPPLTGLTVCKNEMIMGNLFQQSRHEGTFNARPFEGNGILGYDNVKKVFQNSWIDNIGSGISTMEGTYNEKTQTFTFKGKLVDPIGGREVKVRETLQIIDDNNQLLQMYSTGLDGKEMKSMEIRSTRN